MALDLIQILAVFFTDEDGMLYLRNASMKNA